MDWMSQPHNTVNSDAEFGASAVWPPPYLQSFYRWLITLFPMLSMPYIQDSIRLLAIGIVIEAGRSIGNWAKNKLTGTFFVTAHFQGGDRALEWITAFVNAQPLWTESRDISISTVNPRKTGWIATKELGAAPPEGSAQARYTPTSVTFELFRWRRYLVKISRGSAAIGGYSSGIDAGWGAPPPIIHGPPPVSLPSMTITIFTRRKSALQELVEESRQFFERTAVPPANAQIPGGLEISAMFCQGDVTYSWLLDFFIEKQLWSESMELRVTSKETAKRWAMPIKCLRSPTDSVLTTEAPPGFASHAKINEKDTEKTHDKDKDNEPVVPTRAYYEPSNIGQLSPQMFCWKGTWMTVTYTPGHIDWQPDKEVGGSLTLRLYTTNRKVLDDLIGAAATRYRELDDRKITVYMSNNYEWTRSTTKSARPLNSVILPDGLCEMIIADTRDFLRSKSWYTRAGIPHRRGYLLWGVPGTGKSTTIHAVAGELQLEIYCLSLSNAIIDDSTLQVLISATPENCIILIEDIDCAFPTSREDDALDQAEIFSARYQQPPMFDGGPGTRRGPRQARKHAPKNPNSVTLAGLLNLLDSVTSEEGRLIFATTNHIDQLDPALLRPGRMDVKIEYTYATRSQAERLFLQFFPPGKKDGEGDEEEAWTDISTPHSTAPSEDQTAAVDPTSPLKADDERPLPNGIKKLVRKPVFVVHKCLGPPSSEMSPSRINALSTQFGDNFPEDEFTMADLQGFLLTTKWDPVGAAEGLSGWVAELREEEREKIDRIRKREEGEGAGGEMPGLGNGISLVEGSRMQIRPVSSPVSRPIDY